MMKGAFSMKAKKIPKASLATVESLPPPSYAEEPPTKYTDDSDSESRDDDDDDDDVPEPAYRSNKTPPRACPVKSHKFPSGEDNDLEDFIQTTKSRKGKGRAKDHNDDDHIASKSHNRGHKETRIQASRIEHSDEDKGNAPTRNKAHSSKALVRRKPTGSDYEDMGDSESEDDVPTDGHRNRTRATSRALVRGSESASAIKNRRERYDDDNVDENYSPKWRRTSIHRLGDMRRFLIGEIFEVSDLVIESWCIEGMIKADPKTLDLNMDKLFPLYPGYIKNRWKDAMKRYKRELKEERNELQPTVVREVVHHVVPVVMASPIPRRSRYYEVDSRCPICGWEQWLCCCY